MVLAEQKMGFPQLTWPSVQKAAFWLILATSVALNVSFLGGYFHAGSEAGQVRGKGAATVIADRLGLDAGQRALFQDLRIEARAEEAVLRRANTSAVDSFWTELSKPQPDTEMLMSFVQAVAEQNADFTLRIAVLMRQFLDRLSVNQQRQLIEVVRTRPLMRGRFLMSGQ